MNIIKRNKTLDKNVIKLLYEIINNLLYCKEEHDNLRLYISFTLKYDIFKLTHDKINYFEYTRTYKKLITDLFIYNITIKLYTYIRHYSHYQIN